MNKEAAPLSQWLDTDWSAICYSINSGPHWQASLASALSFIFSTTDTIRVGKGSITVFLAKIIQSFTADFHSHLTTATLKGRCPTLDFLFENEVLSSASWGGSLLINGAVRALKKEKPLPMPVSLVSQCCCLLCTWHHNIGREAGLRFHTHPSHERLSMWESLKCIHAHIVEEAQGHNNGCRGLACLSEPKTTFSVSLAAGMFELYNSAGSHRWECHMWALIKCSHRPCD